MNREKSIAQQRQRREWRVRNRVRGDAERPRLTVFRSHRHIYAQLIDDVSERTLCAAATRTLGTAGATGGTVDAAKQVGTVIAEKALAINIKRVRFDRGPYKYHGRVRALADAAREKGLEF